MITLIIKPKSHPFILALLASAGVLVGCGSDSGSSGGVTEPPIDVIDPDVLTCADGQQLPIPTLELQQTFGEPENVEVRTRGIWAFWWDKRFDHEADLEFMASQLDEVRCNAINELQMQDPPNLARGVYYNVYIHHGEADRFPGEILREADHASCFGFGDDLSQRSRTGVS